jgi:ParB family transcriptional regulator, chromosome partitioning protein
MTATVPELSNTAPWLKRWIVAKGKRFTLPGQRLSDLKTHVEKKVLESSAHSEVVTDILLTKLSPAPWNARRFFDPKALEALGKDLQANGQIQPILVRPKGQGFEIVVGERRYRAAKLVGLDKLKATIQPLSDDTAQRLSLSENLEREDLNPYEETLGYLHLLTHQLKTEPAFKGFTTKNEPLEQATKRLLYSLLGKINRSVNNVINAHDMEPLKGVIDEVFSSIGRMTWQSFVQNRLPILDLSDDILHALQGGKLEYTKALALSKVKDESRRAKLLEKTLEQGLSLTDIRTQVKALQTPKKQKQPDFYTRASSLAKTLKKPSVVKDPATKKRIETLLSELEQLLANG